MNGYRTVLGDLHIASGSECVRMITCFFGAGDNLKLLMLDIAQLFSADYTLFRVVLYVECNFCSLAY